MRFLTGKSIRAIVIMSATFALGTLALAPSSQASDAYHQGFADGERAGEQAARDDQPPDERPNQNSGGGCCPGQQQPPRRSSSDRR